MLQGIYTPQSSCVIHSEAQTPHPHVCCFIPAGMSAVSHQPQQYAPVHHSCKALARWPLRAQLKAQQPHKRLVAVTQHLQLRGAAGGGSARQTVCGRRSAGMAQSRSQTCRLVPHPPILTQGNTAQGAHCTLLSASAKRMAQLGTAQQPSVCPAPLFTYHVSLVKAVCCCPLLHLLRVTHCDCHHLVNTSSLQHTSLKEHDRWEGGQDKQQQQQQS